MFGDTFSLLFNWYFVFILGKGKELQYVCACLCVCVLHKLSICWLQKENTGRTHVHPRRLRLYKAAALMNSLGFEEEGEKMWELGLELISFPSSSFIPSAWW